MKWFEKLGYKKADGIVSLLPNAHSYINAISKDASKFNWIPNGIDKSLLQHEKLTDEITKQIPKDKFIVGYTGTMGMANASAMSSHDMLHTKASPESSNWPSPG